MYQKTTHIPFIETISDFFKFYGMGAPLHPEIMCMKLEDQPDERLLDMPLCRSNFFRVIHFTNTNLSFTGGEKIYTISDNCMCFTYPGKLESWTRKGPLTGYVTYFTPAFLGLDMMGKHFDSDYPFFNFNSEPVLYLSSEDTSGIIKCAEEMIKEMYSTAPDKLEMLKKILQVYLHHVKRIYNNHVKAFTEETRIHKSLFNRFRLILDETVHQLPLQTKVSPVSVSLIAKQLTVNPNYLNSLIKVLSGKTASTHIQEKLILEAKSFLLHTEIQVAGISYRLGFENPSYFSRFFKKNTGLSPSDFREKFTPGKAHL